MLYSSGADESLTPSLRFAGDSVAPYKVYSSDERILAFAKCKHGDQRL
jgi:hypothetical protein